MHKEDRYGNPSQRTAPNGDINQSPSFADLLDEYSPVQIRKGQYLEGEILHIDENVILADVDAKRTAIIPPHDLERVDPDILDSLTEGDEVILYVLDTPVGDEDLLVSLQKGLEQKDWQEAKECLAREEVLELEVIGHNKGGLTVAFGHLRGFVPTSHVPQLYRNRGDLVNNKARLVGENLPLQVIEVDRKRRRLVLSAKSAERELRRERLLELEQIIGESVTGRVTNLVDFGAFVDLEGIEGLVHISEIAWQHVNNPGDFLTLGQEIKVQVLAVDVDRERVGLSRKALLPNPWEQIAQTHGVGDLVEGVVSGIVDFGAFVRIAGNIEGLIHVSQMHGTHSSSPQDVLKKGDTVLARITSIEPLRERMGLSQRQVSRSEELEWIWQKQLPMSTSEMGSNHQE